MAGKGIEAIYFETYTKFQPFNQNFNAHDVALTR